MIIDTLSGQNDIWLQKEWSDIEEITDISGPFAGFGSAAALLIAERYGVTNTEQIMLMSDRIEETAHSAAIINGAERPELPVLQLSFDYGEITADPLMPETMHMDAGVRSIVSDALECIGKSITDPTKETPKATVSLKKDGTLFVSSVHVKDGELTVNYLSDAEREQLATELTLGARAIIEEVLVNKV